MSKVSNYQGCILKFVEERSCIKDLDNEIKSIIIENVSKSDCIASIFLLTIMGRQQRKNNISFNGYHIAVVVELIDILFKFLRREKVYRKKYNNYDYLINMLVISINRSFQLGIESLKGKISKDKIFDIYNTSHIIINDTLTNLFKPYNIETKNNRLKHDLATSYFKKDEEKLIKLSHVKQIEKEVLLNHIMSQIGSIYETSVSLGWLFGCSDRRQLNKTKQFSHEFAMIVAIALDFENIDDDLDNLYNNTTINYIINHGLQESFEKYFEYKYAFLISLKESRLKTDDNRSKSDTISELIKLLDKKVETVIDGSSPDLKSSYSTLYSMQSKKKSN